MNETATTHTGYVVEAIYSNGTTAILGLRQGRPIATREAARRGKRAYEPDVEPNTVLRIRRVTVTIELGELVR